MAKNRHLKSSTPRKDQMDAYVNRVANEEYKAIVKKWREKNPKADTKEM